MVGMLLGILVVRLTGGSMAALWIIFLLLTAFHVYGETPSGRMHGPLITQSVGRRGSGGGRNPMLSACAIDACDSWRGVQPITEP